MVKARLLTAMFVASAVLAGLSGWAHADWVSEVTASNPLNWWRFEEEVGATVAADIGSENLDGNYTNDVALQQVGVVGKSAGFDAVDDYVFLGAENVTGDWSVEVIFEAGPGGASQGLNSIAPPSWVMSILTASSTASMSTHLSMYSSTAPIRPRRT